MDQTGHLTMRSLPIGDRPYEKLQKFGAKALSDAELLAVIIRSGSRQETALALCQRLMARDGQAGHGLAAIEESSLEELTQIPGIEKVKAIQIKAAVEIGCRAASDFRNVDKPAIRSPEDALALLGRLIACAQQLDAVLVERLPGLGQRQAPRRAVEQAHVQVRLEFRHLPGHC